MLADRRYGLPGSDRERIGSDGSAAIQFGDDVVSIATVESWFSISPKILDRWNEPGGQVQSWHNEDPQLALTIKLGGRSSEGVSCLSIVGSRLG